MPMILTAKAAPPPSSLLRVFFRFTIALGGPSSRPSALSLFFSMYFIFRSHGQLILFRGAEWVVLSAPPPLPNAFSSQFTSTSGKRRAHSTNLSSHSVPVVFLRNSGWPTVAAPPHFPPTLSIQNATRI